MIEKNYYSIKQKIPHSKDLSKNINVLELISNGIEKMSFTSEQKHYLISRNAACLSTCSGLLKCSIKNGTIEQEIDLSNNEIFNVSSFIEHFDLDTRIVRIVTADWQKSTNYIIKRETKRKKKLPNQIGNMTSSTTIIMIYNQIELFVKLFHNGKFQINGNPSNETGMLKQAMQFLINQLNSAAKISFPKLNIEFSVKSLYLNMINYKHRYWFNQPNTCINIEKFANILQDKYVCKNYGEGRKMLIQGKVPIYSVRYNMEKAMLYIKYLTPKDQKTEKKTCIIISVSGKVNMQGCNDNRKQVQKIFDDISEKIHSHADSIIVQIR